MLFNLLATAFFTPFAFAAAWFAYEYILKKLVYFAAFHEAKPDRAILIADCTHCEEAVFPSTSCNTLKATLERKSFRTFWIKLVFPRVTSAPSENKNQSKEPHDVALLPVLFFC